MKFKSFLETDVLVMGAGLAGCIAAISAAQAGAKVCLVSSTEIFSGSSFYPGTWGLGLIAPDGTEDETDLVETILRVGEQVADRHLVEIFVSHITESIQYLEQMGMHLKEAENKGEREFIPCFDHKNRSWHGLLQNEMREIFLQKMKALTITCLPHTQIVESVMEGNRVCGALAFSREHGCIFLSAKSTVLASGGMGGLFQYRLNTSDITGMGQFIGLRSGCSLINLEFMQMMPGYLSPAPKTIFNEKVFRYSRFCFPGTQDSIWADWELRKQKDLLELRSAHGPYTSRLASGEIDEKLFRCFLQDSRGVSVSYREEIWDNQPEFVKTYFDWLAEKKHITVRDPFQMGIFAHASNGGIQIDEHAATGVAGLFACGEVTGGMHGADRLGGLSTANGLVFGRIAGASAAKMAAKELEQITETEERIEWIPGADAYLEEIRQMNFVCAMILRDEHTIKEAQKRLLEIRQEVQEQIQEVRLQTEKTAEELKKTYECKAAILLTEGLQQAILLRRESRGSHHRVDYPNLDESLDRWIACTYNRKNRKIKTEFVKEKQEVASCRETF
ncbi:MAG: FAD-binding protein [Hungatella sp.]